MIDFFIVIININISATVPSARSACNGPAGDCSTLVLVFGFFLLSRVPHPLQSIHCTQVRSPRGPVSSMLAHLGALDRHLGANMPQESLKMTPRCQTKYDLGANMEPTSAKIAPRCLRHHFQAPQKCRKPKKTYSFSMFFTLQPWCQSPSKMLPEPPQKLPS